MTRKVSLEVYTTGKNGRDVLRGVGNRKRSMSYELTSQSDKATTTERGMSMNSGQISR